MRSAKAFCTMIPALLMLGGCSGPASGPEVAAESGEHLYQVFCSSCHGLSGEGDGPVARVLTVPPADLTRIAQRNGGAFPSAEIFRIIDGQATLPAHGTREMPVWGYEFFGDAADDEIAHQQATDRIERIIGYLRQIQRTD